MEVISDQEALNAENILIMPIRIEVQTESVQSTQLVRITDDSDAVTVQRGWGIGVSGQHSQSQSLFYF